VNIPVKIGLGNRNEELINNSIIGIDGHINYYLRGHDKMLSPYLLAGLGVVLENKDSVNMQFPVGAGIDIKMAPNAYLTWQSEFRTSTKDDKNNFHHSIGFKYIFGGKQEIVEIPPPVDTDGDGITDGMDECPRVPGIEAFNGCPDTDADGIQDSEDDCPEYPGLRELKGCPDSDNDGVSDKDDECPNEPGLKELNGCPRNDRDNDGIIDDEDKCPDQAGLARFDGCPDSDGDGITDANDDCPTLAGVAKYNGCPDTDGDGIPDPTDRCPNTVGPASNSGCPIIEVEDKEVLEFAMQAVQFDHSKATLRPQSYGVLDQIVDIMGKYTDYKLEISGHTDNTGTTDFNQRLSELRAKTCYDYLALQGVSKSRMSYVGFGELRPIAENETYTGRSLNRRVEFNLFPGQ
jgi:outer membrane protein OmpA-like peptidoglycan-associated protein